MLDAMRDNTCMDCRFSNIVEKAEVMERIYDLLDERGFTPRAQGYSCFRMSAASDALGLLPRVALPVRALFDEIILAVQGSKGYAAVSEA